MPAAAGLAICGFRGAAKLAGMVLGDCARRTVTSVDADGGETAPWVRSGAMFLTGTPACPAGPPTGLVPRLADLAGELEAAASWCGTRVVVDPLQLLVDRAALAGFARHGAVSCGGRTRLLRASDGWIGVSLAREEDKASLPAWLGLLGLRPATNGDHFEDLAGPVSVASAAELMEAGQLLGIPVAQLGCVRSPGTRWQDAYEERELPCATAPGGHGLGRLAGRLPLVVDLSGLWAGPLCTSLLREAGARVVKVESLARPDGARFGVGPFFDLLNCDKESVALDFSSADDLALLRSLLQAADVVVEASRPRALAQLGVDAYEVLATSPTVWVSITGYGREGARSNWVAFGDDAAVAGGLVVWVGDRPSFCADAVADPLTGLVAAVASLRALERRASVLIDVPLSRAAAAFAPASPARAPRPGRAGRVDRPRPRHPARRAAALGADTERIRRELQR